MCFYDNVYGIPWYNWYNNFLGNKKSLNEFKLFFIRTFSRAENSYKHFLLKKKIKFLLNIKKTQLALK
jgi:hypothetical protein